MSVVVLSCGRTGTNVALEILSGHPELKASSVVENKTLVKPIKEYPKNYLTKCDTIYFNSNQLDGLMSKNPEMRIIWTIRDPRDIMLSKIFRGQPNSEGRGNWTSADGTPDAAKESMEDMKTKLERLMSKWGHKVMLIKMEDMISNTEETAKSMCKFLGLEYSESMINFPTRMRNSHKNKRYGNKIHQSQVSLWSRVDDIYDGFFTKQEYDVENEFGKLTDLIEFFDYEL